LTAAPHAGISLAFALALLFALGYLVLSLFLSTLQALGPVTTQRLISHEPRLLRFPGQQLGDALFSVRVSLQVAHRTCYAAALLLLLTDLWRRGLSPGRIVTLGVVAFAVLAVLEQSAARPLAALDPERLFRAIVPALAFLNLALWPVGAAVAILQRALGGGVARPAGTRIRPEEEVEREIEAFIDVGEKEGVVDQGESALLKGALEFGDTLVREVMTPRVEVVAVERSATLEALRDLVSREKHSRIPVYHDNLDHIEGIIHIRDMIPLLGRSDPDAGIESLVRPAHFVPESKRVADLLRDMQRSRQQLAVVVDEYGGTAGVVTLEDLLEEIVGEIVDEHERDDTLQREDEGVYVASGLVELDRVEDLFGVQLSGGQVDTLGGLIFASLGRIPERGERLEIAGIRMEILEADARRIYRVRLSASAQAPPGRAA
jgi:CBS domain containing-hemolysin-like protein